MSALFYLGHPSVWSCSAEHFLQTMAAKNRVFHCLSMGSTAVRLWGQEMRRAVAGVSSPVFSAIRCRNSTAASSILPSYRILSRCNFADRLETLSLHPYSSEQVNNFLHGHPGTDDLCLFVAYIHIDKILHNSVHVSVQPLRSKVEWMHQQ